MNKIHDLQKDTGERTRIIGILGNNPNQQQINDIQVVISEMGKQIKFLSEKRRDDNKRIERLESQVHELRSNSNMPFKYEE